MSDLFDFRPPPPTFAVIGNPVGHSKSPRIHALFAAQCGLRIDYRAIQVDPGGFVQALRNFQAAGGQGLNVTVPFKEEAFAVMDRLSERAALARAVNTIVFEKDGTLFGDNTDGAGLVTDLTRNLGVPPGGRALLLIGAGGAARGAIGPLLAAGPASLVIANRTVDRAVALARDFAALGPVRAHRLDGLDGMSFDIVINATSASIAGQLPAVPATVFSASALAYDMMYGERPTVFMDWCASHGVRAVDGLGMLVEQAAESFLLWHGVRPDSAPVLAALRASAC